MNWRGLAIGSELEDAQREQAQAQLVSAAARVFNGELIELIDSIRRDKEQTIDHDDIDILVFAGWSNDAQTTAQNLSQEFADYLASQKDHLYTYATVFKYYLK